VTTWGGPEEALRASRSGRNLMENAPHLEEDIPFCAQESVLEVVPRLVVLHETTAEIAL
jgi:phosphosulfolactate phosphohydrolase-like enzyme